MERVLTQRELNRATLARQMLLERKRVSVVAAVERLAGMQSQWAPAPYVGLWTRVAGFRRDQLERAMLERRIVRAVLMRGAIHLVSLADYGIFGTAVRRPPWLKPDAAALGDRLHDAVRAFGREPRTRAEIAAFLDREHGVDVKSADAAWYALRTNARLTHAPESGLWQPRGKTRYMTIESAPVEGSAARAELVRRYLAAFGPATRTDVAEWSGLRVTDVQPALDALEPLRRFADERGRELFDLPRAPRPPADSQAPVRLLPRFDNLVLSHKDRTRVLPEEYRGGVIDGGWVKSSFLVDGLVAGVWEVEQGRIRVEPFAPLPRAVRRELEDEAAGLEAWLG
ncbi:MAG TPA: winged helix DNA-binding domain-containing protein [Gaiellaceae bacterium]|nr:winged helix DNA-binding domain-containing protein [Gaiellaceae bacterium]